MVLEDRHHLAQQLITGGMATGVVDQFELIQIQITEHMLRALLLALLLQTGELAFKGAAIDEAGEGVMG